MVILTVLFHAVIADAAHDRGAEAGSDGEDDREHPALVIFETQGLFEIVFGFLHRFR